MEIIDTSNNLITSMQGSRALRLISQILVACVACLIFLGALVTSHQAGLSVPDWPTTYGYNMFLYPISLWRGGILYEHSHRLLASLIGGITVLLFVWTLVVEKRSWVKLLSLIALLMVITQGIIGGLTVLYLLPTALSVSHAMLGQTFLLVVITLAYAHSHELLNRPIAQLKQQTDAFRISLISLGLLYIQLFLGAFMRHTHSGLAIPDFPTMGGKWLPYFDAVTLRHINSYLAQIGSAPVELDQVLIHLAHRGFAFIVIFYLIWAGVRLMRIIQDPPVRRGSLFIMLTAVAQVGFGVATIWSGKHPYITSLHVVLGAILLGLVALQTLRLTSWSAKDPGVQCE